MEKKTIRLIIILFAVLFQISFLAVVFPIYQVPNIILMLAIAWTIHVGFIKIFPWIIILGIVHDIATFQTVGISVILFILISYFVSFFSRRFLIEHRIGGMITILFFIIIATLFNSFSNLAIGNIANSNLRSNMLFLVDTSKLQIIFNILVFLTVYFPLKKIEDFLSFYDQRIKIK